MKPGEPEASAPYSQILAPVVEFQEGKVDCVIAYYHTALEYHPDSRRVECSDSGL